MSNAANRRSRWSVLLSMGVLVGCAAAAWAQDAPEEEAPLDPIVGVWAEGDHQFELRADGTWVQLPEEGPSDQAVLCEQLGSGDVAASCVGRWAATEADYEISDPHLHNLEGDQIGCGCSYRTIAAQLDGDVLTFVEDGETIALTRVAPE